MNLLARPLIRANCAGQSVQLSLPDVLAALMGDRIAAFPALRAHQWQAWHCLLAQLGALALDNAGITEPPEDAVAWAGLLRALTPNFPEDEPWCLTAPPDRPAFLQPPVAEGNVAGWNTVSAPDALDILITSKNHDVKTGRMRCAEADDWLFALVSLQTLEGFLGAGKYGIARMNGGFSSRAFMGLRPPGGDGQHLRRDIGILLKHRDAGAELGLRSGGTALTWLLPWNGKTSLAFAGLDPLFVEACRRIRLGQGIARALVARTTTSVVSRIAAKELKGNTADPWAPLNAATATALSVTAGGFHYARVCELLFEADFVRPPAAVIAPSDPEQGLELRFVAIARGQGKTEGLHQRSVPVSKVLRDWLGGMSPTDDLATMAKARVADAGAMRGSILRPALFVLAQAGPESPDYGKKSTSPEVAPFLSDFKTAVDRDFFPALWREAETSDPAAREAIRRGWIHELADIARDLIRQASDSLPLPGMRRPRARARAERTFEGLLRRGPLSHIFQEHANERPAS
jgi:CRISPR system Cascade subunit CasA